MTDTTISKKQQKVLDCFNALTFSEQQEVYFKIQSNLTERIIEEANKKEEEHNKLLSLKDRINASSGTVLQ